MQEGNHNSPPTMVCAMCEIFKDIIIKDIVIYIENIIIFLVTYEEHVATLRNVL